MHSVRALIEIQIEDDVAVVLEIRRRKRDVSDRHGELLPLGHVPEASRETAQMGIVPALLLAPPERIV